MILPASGGIPVEQASWPFGAALAVSWRACISAAALLALPLAASLWVLSLLGDFEAGISVAVAVVCYPVSLYLHELGHLCGVRWFAPHTLSAVRLNGTWGRARIERPSAGKLGDACISIVGPIAGLWAMIPIAFLPGDPLYLGPWVLLYQSHLFALAPWSSDGRQVLRVFVRNHGDLGC